MRKTRLVRVSEKWHKYLKAEAREFRKPISRMVDYACKYYSGERRREKREKKAQMTNRQKTAITDNNDK